MINDALKYLGQSNIGFTNPGECEAFYNQVTTDVTGVKYIIRDANVAKDLMIGNNTRPDLCQQIKNIDGDPNQLPSIGDWVIFDATWGNGCGHVVCVESRSSIAFVAIEQNYVYHKVTRQNHVFNSHVLGWIHFFCNDPAPAPAPVPTPPAPTPTPVPVPPEPTPIPTPIVEPTIPATEPTPDVTVVTPAVPQVTVVTSRWYQKIWKVIKLIFGVR